MEEIMNSLLFEAVRSEDLEAIQTLISEGADVNARDEDGKTAFDYLEHHPNQEQSKKIIDLIRQKQQEEELEKLRQQEEELSNATEEMGQHNIGQGSCCIIC